MFEINATGWRGERCEATNSCTGDTDDPTSLLALAILALTITAAACGNSTSQATTKASGSATASPSPLASGTTAVPSGDWPRFDYDAQRSGVYPSSTGIDRSDLGRLERRVVHLSGVADSSAVELHAVRAGGRVRDLIFLTDDLRRDDRRSTPPPAPPCGATRRRTSPPTRAAGRSRPPRRSSTRIVPICMPPLPTASSTSSPWLRDPRCTRGVGRRA